MGQFFVVAELSGSKGIRKSNFGGGRRAVAKGPGVRFTNTRASLFCH